MKRHSHEAKSSGGTKQSDNKLEILYSTIRLVSELSPMATLMARVAVLIS